MKKIPSVVRGNGVDDARSIPFPVAHAVHDPHGAWRQGRDPNVSASESFGHGQTCDWTAGTSVDGDHCNCGVPCMDYGIFCMDCAPSELIRVLR